MNPMITRGLWIPDPNFRFGTGSGTAWTEGTSMASIIDEIPTSEGSGSSIRIALDSLAQGAQEYIQTEYTPMGVAASPFLSGSSATEFLVMAVVKTENVSTSNSNDIITASLYGRTDTGSSAVSDTGITFKDTAGSYFRYSTDWTVIVGEASLAANSGTDWYRLQLQFADDSVSSASDYLHIAWVGIAAPIDVSTPGDYFTSFYGADCSLSMQANPLGVGGLVRSFTMPWPSMDSADKDIIDECIAWNSKVPRSGVSSNSNGTTQDLSNNGSAQPLIIAIDRDDYKGAFYANLAPASFAPNAVGFWPSSGAKHATALTFIEQDRPRA